MGAQRNQCMACNNIARGSAWPSTLASVGLQADIAPIVQVTTRGECSLTRRETHTAIKATGAPMAPASNKFMTTCKCHQILNAGPWHSCSRSAAADCQSEMGCQKKGGQLRLKLARKLLSSKQRLYVPACSCLARPRLRWLRPARDQQLLSSERGQRAWPGREHRSLGGRVGWGPSWRCREQRKPL